EFKDPDGKWYGWSYWYNELAINTDLTDELDLDIPESWQDLIDPQYKDEIVMPDPSVSGTGYLFVSTMMQILGEEEAWDYFEKLDENVGQYVESADVPGQMAAQVNMLLVSLGTKQLAISLMKVIQWKALSLKKGLARNWMLFGFIKDMEIMNL